jgi:hypothetical protein
MWGEGFRPADGLPPGVSGQARIRSIAQWLFSRFRDFEVW